MKFSFCEGLSAAFCKRTNKGLSARKNIYCSRTLGLEPLEARALLSASLSSQQAIQLFHASPALLARNDAQVAATLTAGALTPPGTPTVSTFVSSGLNGPRGLAFNAGNLYVANYGNSTICEVTPAGAVSTFVSSGLDAPRGLAFNAGNLYVANWDNNTISKVAPKGTVSTVVSSGLNDPANPAFRAGNLYVSNFNGNTISEVTPAGAVSTFVSSGLNGPEGMAFDGAGNLYVANWGDGTISKVTPKGAVSTFASGLNGPEGLAFDAAGNLYVTNWGDSTISEVTPAGVVSTFISSGVNGPYGPVFDAAGNLYVANYGNSTISEITPSSVTEGQAFSGTVFHFTDANPLATASDYTVVVTLGDGHSVTLNSKGVAGKGPAHAGGRIVADAGGGFDVQLSYTYAEAFRNRTFSVKVTAVDGASTSASTKITVVGPVSLSKSTITVSPSHIASGGTATVTLTARDANGNQELSGGPVVQFALGGTPDGTLSGVTDNGNGTYTATFTGTAAGSNTITAAIGKKAVTSKKPTVTVSNVAGITTASSLGQAPTNAFAIDATLRALLLDESAVTGKPRPLFEP